MMKLKLSYSRISDYDRNGARALLEKRVLDSVALHKGSLINDLLFDNVDFDKKYQMKIYEKPTATLLKLSNIIIDNYSKIPTIEEIIEIIKLNEFWKSTKEENLRNSFDKPEFWEYLEIKMNINSKIPITPSMKIEADEIVYILKNHENSKYLFKNPDIEIHAEIPFEIEYRKIILRGIVDMVELNRQNRTIRIIDLKTGGDSFSEFEFSIVKWRYFLQEAVYMKAINYLKKLLNVEDYTVLPFQFLYIGLKEKIPVFFQMTDKWHKSAIHGFTTKSGFRYKGLDELITEIEYHWKNKIYDIPYHIHNLKGQLNLNDKFIETYEC